METCTWNVHQSWRLWSFSECMCVNNEYGFKLGRQFHFRKHISRKDALDHTGSRRLFLLDSSSPFLLLTWNIDRGKQQLFFKGKKELKVNVDFRFWFHEWCFWKRSSRNNGEVKQVRAGPVVWLWPRRILTKKLETASLFFAATQPHNKRRQRRHDSREEKRTYEWHTFRCIICRSQHHFVFSCNKQIDKQKLQWGTYPLYHCHCLLILLRESDSNPFVTPLLRRDSANSAGLIHVMTPNFCFSHSWACIKLERHELLLCSRNVLMPWSFLMIML